MLERGIRGYRNVHNSKYLHNERLDNRDSAVLLL